MTLDFSVTAQYPETELALKLQQMRDYDLAWIIGDYEYFQLTLGTGMSRPERDSMLAGHVLRNKKGEIIQGLPDAVKLFNTRAVPIKNGDPGWELFLYVFSLNAPKGMSRSALIKAARGVSKEGTFLTDHSGGDWQNAVATAMNVVYRMGPSIRMGGQNVTPIRMIKFGDFESMKEQADLWPWLKIKATISLRTYGGRGVDPFHHLGGRNCNYPMVCDDKGVDYEKWYFDKGGIPLEGCAINWIETARLKPLTRVEQIPNSYYPSRNFDQI